MVSRDSARKSAFPKAEAPRDGASQSVNLPSWRNHPRVSSTPHDSASAAVGDAIDGRARLRVALTRGLDAEERLAGERGALDVAVDDPVALDHEVLKAQNGAAAAAVVAAEIRGLIEARGRAVGIFASAPSQNEFLAALVEAPGIDWSRVVGFHLDEYLGMDDRAPQSFRRFLIDRLVSKVAMNEFHGLRGEDG